MSRQNVNFHPHWNSNERISDSFSKSLSLKVDSPPQLHLNARSLGFNFQDKDPSSPSRSPPSNPDMTANAGTNSQDQCISSESGQEVHCGYNIGQVTPAYFMGHPEAVYNTVQIGYSHEMLSCGDSYCNGSMTAYNTTLAIQPQMMGVSVTTPRVPLPVDNNISEDEPPFYVDARRFHAILRRRQSRARMEAQNKLIKNRKPYLHESRHRHALNRARGSGGRFVSKKEVDSTSGSHSFSGFINNQAPGVW